MVRGAATDTELRLRNLTDGTDRRLAPSLDPDQVQASTWQDLIPHYAFTPDGARADHRPERRLRADRGSTAAVATAIPFRAALRVDVGPTTRTGSARIRGRSAPG